jgi:hypothetical protein
MEEADDVLDLDLDEILSSKSPKKRGVIQPTLAHLFRFKAPVQDEEAGKRSLLLCLGLLFGDSLNTGRQKRTRRRKKTCPRRRRQKSIFAFFFFRKA